jgi:chemotaxis protein CheD
MEKSSQSQLKDKRQARSDSNPMNLLGAGKRSFNKALNINVVKIFSGEWGVSAQDDEMFATILGSCVSACVHDPVSKIGGMNHFLLPHDGEDGNSGESARYGVFAMEMLVNAMLKNGAQKHRLEFKVFGGGNVLINNSKKIGSKNAIFIRKFMRDEGYKVLSEDLEGDQPRSLHYYPTTGKVMLRKLQRKEDLIIIEEEQKYQTKLHNKPIEGDIELF